MHCWIAMHYPHYPVDEAEWFIYVPRGHEHKVALFDESDRVAFYEVARGPDRANREGKRPKGRSGIICIARGSGRPRAAGFQESYVDGRSTAFSLECPCKDHQFQHLLKRQEMFDVLGRKLNLRGLGGGAGFTEISADEFARIEAAFSEASSE